MKHRLEQVYRRGCCAGRTRMRTPTESKGMMEEKLQTERGTKEGQEKTVGGGRPVRGGALFWGRKPPPAY